MSKSCHCLVDLLVDVCNRYADLTRNVQVLVAGTSRRRFCIRGQFGGFEPAQPTSHVRKKKVFGVSDGDVGEPADGQMQADSRN